MMQDPKNGSLFIVLCCTCMEFPADFQCMMQEHIHGSLFTMFHKFAGNFLKKNMMQDNNYCVVHCALSLCCRAFPTDCMQDQTHG